MWADVDKRVARAMRGIRQAFRGVLTLVNSAPAVQLVQGVGLAGEQLQDMELMQHYGFGSNPPAGSMIVVVPVGGNTSHGIIIATEHGQYRLKNLAPGEVALNTDEGDVIHLKRGRVIEVTTGVFRVNASEMVDLNTPKVRAAKEVVAEGKMTGQGGLEVSGGDGAKINGTLHATEDLVADNVSLRGHRHPETGTVTDPPQG
ncbi:phage baseplate assembly protein V [Cupriavidus taiwanensis]|uniref:phage baseplate assembly protein V n=1 Tax=Cupriavidus taiwanensis TaxID=164546 RepID=UPI002541D9DD|nr:phage baseplate assembly protein V [Cupriavidus taiwanensis]MDK3025585.1 phage baseplate assembly protein V [Cupriavidus taiwanensis]